MWYFTPSEALLQNVLYAAALPAMDWNFILGTTELPLPPRKTLPWLRDWAAPCLSACSAFLHSLLTWIILTKVCCHPAVIPLYVCNMYVSLDTSIFCFYHWRKQSIVLRNLMIIILFIVFFISHLCALLTFLTQWLYGFMYNLGISSYYFFVYFVCSTALHSSRESSFTQSCRVSWQLAHNVFTFLSRLFLLCFISIAKQVLSY